MVNLANLLGAGADQTDPTNCSNGNPGKCANGDGPAFLSANFMQQFQSVVNQNTMAAASVANVDLKTLIEGMNLQGQQNMAELLSLLNTIQLLPPEMLGQDLKIEPVFLQHLNPNVEKPYVEIMNIVQDLLSKIDADQTGKVNLNLQGPIDLSKIGPTVAQEDPKTVMNQLPDISNLLQTVMEKCQHLLKTAAGTPNTGEKSIQVDWVPTATAPESVEGSVFQQISYAKIEKTIIALNQNAPNTEMQLSPVKDGAAFVEAFSVAKIHVRKVFAVWIEISQARNVEIQGHSAEVNEAPNLQSQGLLTMIQLFKSRVKANTVKDTNADVQNNVGVNGEDPKTVLASSGNETMSLMEMLGKGKETLNKNSNTTVLSETGEPVLSSKGFSDKTKSDLINIKELFSTLGKPEAANDVLGNTRLDEGSLMGRTDRLIVQQVADRIRIINRGGVHEIRLQLEPKELGQINMKVRLEGGTLTARCTVETTAVKYAIESNISQLRTALEENDIKIEKFDVYVGNGSEHPSHGKDVQDRWAIRKGWKDLNRINGIAGTEEATAGSIDTAWMDTGNRYGYNTVEFLA